MYVYTIMMMSQYTMHRWYIQFIYLDILPQVIYPLRHPHYSI